MPDILPYLQKIQKRFEDPTYQMIYKGYTRTFLLEFPDLGETYVFHIEDGQSATLEKGTTTNPDLTISVNSDVLAGIMEKKINPMTAYSTRKVKAVGEMDDLLKLQKLL